MQGRGERSFGTPVSRGGPAPQSAFLLRHPFPPPVLRLVIRSGVLQHGTWPDFGTALPRNYLPDLRRYQTRTRRWSLYVQVSIRSRGMMAPLWPTTLTAQL